jgi:hypothetical protein
MDPVALAPGLARFVPGSSDRPGRAKRRHIQRSQPTSTGGVKI